MPEKTAAIPTFPLAFKGPDDHLARYCDQRTLYAGLKFLLDGNLLEWHFDATRNEIRGRFWHHASLAKVSLQWPLKGKGWCACSPVTDTAIKPWCVHQCALAIAGKSELDRIQPLAVRTPKQISDIEYLQAFIRRPMFEPYPNMARHRVAYVIAPCEQGLQVKLLKSYLTQQNEFIPKADLPLNVIDKKLLPKFITCTDYYLIEQLRKQATNESKNEVILPLPVPEKLAKIMLMTGRVFWKSGHRQPIEFRPTVAVDQAKNIFEGFVLASNHQQVFTARKNHPTKIEQAIEFKPSLKLTSRQLATHEDCDLALVRFTVGPFELSLEQVLQQIETSHQQYPLLAKAIRLLDHWPTLQSTKEPVSSYEFSMADRLLDPAWEVNCLLLYQLNKLGWQIAIESDFRFARRFADHVQVSVTPVKEISSSKENADKLAAQLSLFENTKQPSVQSVHAISDWFDVALTVTIDGEKVSLLPYLQSILNDEQAPPLAISNGGKVYLTHQQSQDIRQLLELLSPSKKALESGRLKLPIAKLIALQSHLQEQDFQWQAHQQVEAIWKQWQSTPTLYLSESIQSQLRAYQREGVEWIERLYRCRLGGVLADDMGLGKTLQTIAFISHLIERQRLKQCVLIVAPTSVLFNWVQEFKKFAPTVKLLVHHGSKRKAQQKQWPYCQVIVTSYGTMVKDIEILREFTFDAVILDEAQNIKNHRTANALAAYQLRSNFKLCLTGTPVENHLAELWSLFRFLMPGFLGSIGEFNQVFRYPIERDKDQQRRTVLAQRIAPFVLRRKKEAVAKELPKKTEIDELIPLLPQQAALYEAIRVSAQKQLLGDGKKQTSAIHVANALLRLRQVCCHSALVDKAQIGEGYSSKFLWLENNLPELIENNRSILIFSQFTQLLDLLGRLLKKLKIPYLQLTGKSTSREQLVASFQGGEVPIFLISLKAGGTGLNLTRADTVIHLDPWWNAAAQMQATDRAYRIGQDKPVFVYRLIAKDSVEEKICKMQQDKLSLAENILTTESGVNLARRELERLLKPISESVED